MNLNAGGIQRDRFNANDQFFNSLLKYFQAQSYSCMTPFLVTQLLFFGVSPEHMSKRSKSHVNASATLFECLAAQSVQSAPKN